jgi:hypothetical protein
MDSIDPSEQPARPTHTYLLHGREAVRETGIAIAESARRQLRILGQELESTLYADPRFVAAIRQLALAHPAMPVRILIADGASFARTTFRLVTLAQRLPSRIAIRRLPEEELDHPESALIADRSAYLRRHRGEGGGAVVDFQGRREARRLEATFDRLWDQSEPAIELRRLTL